MVIDCSVEGGDGHDGITGDGARCSEGGFPFFGFVECYTEGGRLDCEGIFLLVKC